ncbi:DNA mismatch repair protein MutL [Neolewinella xylanilytica]|uniref:DNA mismatch repair protein MutL n=1 Tax=Neolewinella xylanilytica TaxID=1514080 RepID=A0A2S6I2Q4_9BACT|nr:DNA mismatch repair endonuclease MutL [Neolewinella xylanilytica]PPK85464.1 DNA mismatch repair protein MutL [Neolewinella xylanilytica]
MSDNLVQLLPDAIANQIAAGEVIQRPASVVKELVENAVDAGASEVSLIVKDAGKSLIQVIDNGCGMSETDARMSLERHATSKLRTAADLFTLHTMGFRGEALASIVAIAQVEMKTRRATDDLGTRITVESSEVQIQEPTAAPPGTSIAVRNLFFNVPARRNFLKSDSVELRHIREEYIRIALAHPTVRFDLHVNDKLDLSLVSGNLRQRVIAVFGKKYRDMLVPIEEATDVLSIGGYVGKPEAARKSKVGQFFFINDRYIRSSYLHHAVTMAYDELLGKDSYPFYVIFLEIDPARIDVNVHPTKQEIKFEDERLIYNYLKATIRHGLGRASIMPTIDFESDNPFSPSRTRYSASPAAQDPDQALPSKMNRETPRSPSPDPPGEASRHANNLRQWEQLYENLEVEVDTDTGEVLQSRLGQEEDADTPPAQGRAPVQLHHRYILSAIKSGWLLIDQQAAHERILYEGFLRTLREKPATSQKSLFPQTLDLPHADAELMQSLLPELNQLGFDLEAFGGGSFIVRGIPAELAGRNNELDLLERLLQQYKRNVDFSNNGHDRLARTLARAAAIKRGTGLDEAEMRSLIDRLFACEQPRMAPNGKKCFVKYELEAVERLFE